MVFDLDGTLYAMTPRFKVLFTLHCLPTFWRLPQFMKLRKQFQGVDLKNRGHLLSKMAKSFQKEKGFSEAPTWITDTFYPAFSKTLTSLQNRQDIIPLLKTLRKAGLKLAVYSDFGQVEERLEALAIPASLFDVCLSAEDKGALKPSPRPINQLCAEWRLSPQELLLVGDRDDTDGALSQKTGMRFYKVLGTSNRLWSQELANLRSYIFKNR